MNTTTTVRMSPTQRNDDLLSLTAESSRWWWHSAAGGAVATAAVIAIIGTSSPGNAIPVEVDRYHTASASQAPAPRSVPPETRIPVVADPSDLQDGWHPCFMWQSNWHTVLNGAEPVCRTDPDAARAQAGRQGSGRDGAGGALPRHWSEATRSRMES